MASLPVYSDEHLADLSATQLWQLLVHNEDRVPRNVIDECARRGDEIVEHAAAVLDKPYYWGDDQSHGEWWRRLHAVMVLGLVPGERAAALLAAFMRRIDEAQDENLQEWLSGHWASLFRNKPQTALSHLIALAEDRSRSWYARVDAVQALLGYAKNAGGEGLDDALGLTARIVFDETEDFDVRSLSGSSLLDFAKPEYRSGLEALADQQPKDLPIFDRDNVEDVYDRGNIPPPHPRFEDPWQFYAPDAIEERQRRWAEEDAAADEDDAEDLLDEPGVTYVRPAPKIGRNDPCPCGSGKKYKRCCLPKSA